MFLINICNLFSIESDLIPGLATFIACLVLPLQLGILVGIGINIVFILYHAARPKLRVETLCVSIALFRNEFNYFIVLFFLPRHPMAINT